MTKFQIIEGVKSSLYNHFRDYEWKSCTATDTRLMGVVALKMCWKSKTSKFHFYQLIHLDFSEYGIDDYSEYYTSPSIRKELGLPGPSEFKECWQRISGGLGGNQIKIPLDTALCLIQMALDTNENYYRRHHEGIRHFRKYVLARIQLMAEALHDADSAKGKDHPHARHEGAGVVLASWDMNAKRKATQAVSLSHLSYAETINYFIMRLCDKDYIGASMLTSIPIEDLPKFPRWKYELMTLTHNRIHSSKEPGVYHCTTLTEGELGYYYAKVTIELDTSRSKRNAKISNFQCNHFQRFSEVEMAMQMRRPEYITVYRLKNRDHFDPDCSQMIYNAMMSSVPNGILYLLYNEDNRHVDSSRYYMNNDVYGAYLLTPQNELVIMSPEVMKISMMETDIATAFMMKDLKLEGRYKFDSQIFQTFCESPGAYFRYFIQPE